MGLCSVDAGIFATDNDRHHFALTAAQGRIREHGRPIHFHRCLQNTPVGRHDIDDIPDTASALYCFFQLTFDEAASFVNAEGPDEWHGCKPELT